MNEWMSELRRTAVVGDHGGMVMVMVVVMMMMMVMR
jgi:hypothetical protein